MPLGRYFVFTSGLILALLFLADWYMSDVGPVPSNEAIDKTIIRIHSAHKWPEAIVIDTSLPTIVPPPRTLADSAEKSAQQPESMRRAFAQAAPEAVAARNKVPNAASKPVYKRRARTRPVNAGRVASYDSIGFPNTVPTNW